MKVELRVIVSKNDGYEPHILELAALMTALEDAAQEINMKVDHASAEIVHDLLNKVST